jgi:hypothetical protein
MMTMNILERILSPPRRQTTKPDPLRDEIERAKAVSSDAWEAINRRRVVRGERPLAPSWEDLTGPSENRDGAHESN